LDGKPEEFTHQLQWAIAVFHGVSLKGGTPLLNPKHWTTEIFKRTQMIRSITTVDLTFALLERPAASVDPDAPKPPNSASFA
jgi:hypothetical protein